MKKFLLWIAFGLGAVGFTLGVARAGAREPQWYALAAAGLSLLLWAAFKHRRIILSTAAATVATDPPDHETVAAKIDEIEAEMKRICMWTTQAPRPEQYAFTHAFAGDTMAFEEWLQFVFVPRVREMVAARGVFPPRSEVAGQAAREFDACPLDTGRLQTLLHEFDRLFCPSPFEF